jgi:hypothetical protein
MRKSKQRCQKLANEVLIAEAALRPHGTVQADRALARNLAALANTDPRVQSFIFPLNNALSAIAIVTT